MDAGERFIHGCIVASIRTVASLQLFLSALIRSILTHLS